MNTDPNHNAPYAAEARARAEKMRQNTDNKRPRIAANAAPPAPRTEVHPDFAANKADERWNRWLETEKEPTIREYEEFLQWVNRKAQ